MRAHFVPPAGQRSHWYLYATGWDGVHVPGLASSATPTRGVPTMRGRTRFLGGLGSWPERTVPAAGAATSASTSTPGTARQANWAPRGFGPLSLPPTPALTDLDARLVELSLVPVRSGAAADGDVGRVRDRADGRRFRKDLSVDNDLDRGRRLDARDGVPLAVVDRRAGHELGVAPGAFEAAGGLAGLLELHLVLGASGRIEALAEHVQVGRRRWRRAARLEVDREGDVGGARVQVGRRRHADVARGAVEAVGRSREAGQAGLRRVERAVVRPDRVEHRAAGGLVHVPERDEAGRRA